MASIVTFVLMMVEGGPGVAIASPSPLGVPVLFWGAASGAIFFVGASLLEPYRPESTSLAFREIFAGRTPRTPNTDLKVMGVLWALVMLLGVYKNTIGSESAFPPLGDGLGGFLTNAFYLIVVLGLLGVSVYMLARLLGYIRSEVTSEAPAAQTTSSPERT